jgi:hypothetical protein
MVGAVFVSAGSSVPSDVYAMNLNSAFVQDIQAFDTIRIMIAEDAVHRHTPAHTQDIVYGPRGNIAKCKHEITLLRSHQLQAELAGRMYIGDGQAAQFDLHDSCMAVNI